MLFNTLTVWNTSWYGSACYENNIFILSIFKHTFESLTLTFITIIFPIIFTKPSHFILFFYPFLLSLLCCLLLQSHSPRYAVWVRKHPLDFMDLSSHYLEEPFSFSYIMFPVVALPSLTPHCFSLIKVNLLTSTFSQMRGVAQEVEWD